MIVAGLVLIFLVELRIMEADISNIVFLHIWIELHHLIIVFCAVHAILFHANRHLLELHYVACECASLVTEDVVYLTEFFVETTRLHSHWHVFLLVVH